MQLHRCYSSSYVNNKYKKKKVMKKILFAMPVLSVLLLGCHKAEIPNANDYIDEYGINHGPGVEDRKSVV